MTSLNKNDALFCTGVVIANGIPDKHGDVLDKRQIKQLLSSYESYAMDVNHNSHAVKGVNIIENYISDTDKVVHGKVAPAGSWLCNFIVFDENIKHEITEDLLRGLSLGSEPDIIKFTGKPLTYADFDDMDEITPLYISIVWDSSNGYNLDVYPYEHYINKFSGMENKNMSDEQNNVDPMVTLANNVLEYILKSAPNPAPAMDVADNADNGLADVEARMDSFEEKIDKLNDSFSKFVEQNSTTEPTPTPSAGTGENPTGGSTSAGGEEEPEEPQIEAGGEGGECGEEVPAGTEGTTINKSAPPVTDHVENKINESVKSSDFGEYTPIRRNGFGVPIR